MSCFNQRVSYFRRIEDQPDSVIYGALSVDRCELMEFDIGMSAIFGKSLEKHALPRLSDYLDTLLGVKLEETVLNSFKSVLIRSEASVFWAHLEKDGRIPSELATVFSELGYEQARIVLLFLGNMLRWSALVQPLEVCFLCPARFYSTHFFSCQELLLPLTLTDFYAAITTQDFGKFVENIFVALRHWTTSYPSKFAFRFRWNVLAFFDNGGESDN